MDHSGRIRRLHALLLQSDLDGLVYGTGANFQYFTGLPIKWRRMEEPKEPGCLMVLSRSGETHVIVRSDTAELEMKTLAGSPAGVLPHIVHYAEMSRTLGKCLKGKKIGTSREAQAFLTSLVSSACPGVVCVCAEELGESLRMIKDAGEIEKLKRVAGMTGKAMERVVKQIRPGVSQPELRWHVRQAGLDLGAEEVSFAPAALYVKSGTAPSEDPFVYPVEKGLVPGTSIAFDFGFIIDGYCSDFGRSFYCGPAPAHISEAYKAIQEAHCDAIARLGPGKLMLNQVFGLIEAGLDVRGYGDRIRARLKDGTIGHNIGVDLHENPWLRPHNAILLQPGMVIAIEPKVWHPGEYYLRVEDIVLITDNGVEILTSFDRQLFELDA